MSNFRRDTLCAREELRNVGKSIAADLRRIGTTTPTQLNRRDPYALYQRLNRMTGVCHDPRVLDTFIAAVRFVKGAPARPVVVVHGGAQARAVEASQRPARSPLIVASPPCLRMAAGRFVFVVVHI